MSTESSTRARSAAGRSRKGFVVGMWVAGSIAASGVLSSSMFEFAAPESFPVDRSVFLPGETTDGHYQIELSCDSCHAESFANLDDMQQACEGCHSAELERVDDSHPRSKFTDPRNADRVAVLDARWCVTCHQEHRPEITSTMGLSLPGDYCYRCHEDVGSDRPTHEGLPFDSCSSGGCHNFHDNRALYEDFLVEHRNEPMLKAPATLPQRALVPWSVEQGHVSGVLLSAPEHDGPYEHENLPGIVEEWSSSAHAAAGVNCSGCHVSDSGAWSDDAGAACESCHSPEHEGFLTGRHGMRVAAGLSPMTPALARLPMHEEAFGDSLGCESCHRAHTYDVRVAAVEACQRCHADEHTLAYTRSAHYALWVAEQEGRAPAGSGVSCASCHLPRIPTELAPERILVAHNQNDFLRPNEKMIRSSCLTCHGLGFSIDALADPALVLDNFDGRPASVNPSIHYASDLRWKLEGRVPPWTNLEDEE